MRFLALLLAVFHGLNGVAMLVAPDLWYATTPGVSATGPFNVHFVRDIGLAFIGSAAALLFWARTRKTAIPWPAIVFLGGHAGLHLVELGAHGADVADAGRDLLAIVLPGPLPAGLLLAGRPA